MIYMFVLLLRYFLYVCICTSLSTYALVKVKWISDGRFTFLFYYYVTFPCVYKCTHHYELEKIKWISDGSFTRLPRLSGM